MSQWDCCGSAGHGEWWADRRSKATDLGPAVSFTVRVASDDHIAPKVICCYGLRPDVRLDRVIAEADRIVAAYVETGKEVYGTLTPPTIDQWASAQSVMARIRQTAAERHAEGLETEHNAWWPGGVMSVAYWCTGSDIMSRRLIEHVGIDALRQIIRPPDSVMRLWPLTATINGQPARFVKPENTEPFACFVPGEYGLRPSKAEDVWEAYTGQVSG